MSTQNDKLYCLYCHGLIETPRRGQKFCNPKHKAAYHNSKSTKVMVKELSEKVDRLIELFEQIGIEVKNANNRN